MQLLHFHFKYQNRPLKRDVCSNSSVSRRATFPVASAESAPMATT